jgi:hypothetical protein
MVEYQLDLRGRAIPGGGEPRGGVREPWGLESVVRSFIGHVAQAPAAKRPQYRLEGGAVLGQRVQHRGDRRRGFLPADQRGLLELLQPGRQQVRRDARQPVLQVSEPGRTP